MSRIRYNSAVNVLEAARQRIAMIFDNFETINVSISGGKDSTVLAHLALVEANRRGRRIGLFFLDEEVVCQATVEQVEYLMSLYPENTIRLWFQIEFNLTNSVDIGDGQLHCWERGKRKLWMHPRKRENITTRTWSHETVIADKEKGFGFYDALENIQMTYEGAAFLIGLRALESPNRYGAVTRHPGWRDVSWSTRKGNNYNFYPVFDWNYSDIWKYIGENKLRYHRSYDIAFLKGVHPARMRVSSLIHEKSFKSIQELPEFEPKTYERLLARCKGISFAQETARDKKMFAVRKLPKNYRSWREYRDFLLATFPDQRRADIFRKRFSRHLENEYVARQQVRQLVLNDYENNLPVKNVEDPVEEMVKYWSEVL